MIPKIKTKQSRLEDDAINTPEELLGESMNKIWEKDPIAALKYEKIERRKLLNWSARFILSILVVGTFIFMIWLLFFQNVSDGARDLINIMMGAFVAVLSKTTDYWFKGGEDEEHKEAQKLNNAENEQQQPSK